MSNLEIIFRDWLDALRRGDLETISARLAPDVVHGGVRPELTCSGREAVLTRIRRLVAQPPEVTALELLEIGDQVMVSVRAPTIGVPADEHAGPRGQAIIVFTLRDETIVRMQDYLTRTAALNAVNVTDDPWH
jgi:ketosteroid isomerase-like protein